MQTHKEYMAYLKAHHPREYARLVEKHDRFLAEFRNAGAVESSFYDLDKVRYKLEPNGETKQIDQ